MIPRITCEQADALIKKGFLNCTSEERLAVGLHSTGCQRCSDGIEERGRKALEKIPPDRIKELDAICLLVRQMDKESL